MMVNHTISFDIIIRYKSAINILYELFVVLFSVKAKKCLQDFIGSLETCAFPLSHSILPVRSQENGTSKSVVTLHNEQPEMRTQN